MVDLKEMTLSDTYSDYIFRYSDEDSLSLPEDGSYGYQPINSRYLLFHLNNQLYPIDYLANISYSSIPSLYTLTSTLSLEKTGILQLQDSPSLSLDGRGVLVGFLDTGINYLHPAFREEEGNTRILAIWDQTVETGTPPQGFVYGSEYKKEDIDRALLSDSPYQLVPSRDENGHGTALAGIACGSRNLQQSFSGAAPASLIAMVKLKEAKPYLLDYFRVNPAQPVFQESDLMFAVRYLKELSLRYGLPLVICFGIGTNQGSHNGWTPLDQSLSLLSPAPGLALVTAAGNEVGKRQHFSGTVSSNDSFTETEIEVPQNTPGFHAELWGSPPEIFSVGLVSPLGEIIERIPARLGQTQFLQFVLDRTTLWISYELVETESGEQVILLRFQNPTAGIWRLRVYCSNRSQGRFHLWLPIASMVNPPVTFLNPDPFGTIVNPGNSRSLLTTGAFDAVTGSLYGPSGRGDSSGEIQKPDIVTPGTSLTAPNLREGYTSLTGTSAASALCAGACALLLQWGYQRDPARSYQTQEIRSFLIRGALRDLPISYPDPEWGYGKLDLLNVFSVFLSP